MWVSHSGRTQVASSTPTSLHARAQLPYHPRVLSVLSVVSMESSPGASGGRSPGPPQAAFVTETYDATLPEFLDSVGLTGLPDRVTVHVIVQTLQASGPLGCGGVRPPYPALPQALTYLRHHEPSFWPHHLSPAAYVVQLGAVCDGPPRIKLTDVEAAVEVTSEVSVRVQGPPRSSPCSCSLARAAERAHRGAGPRHSGEV